MVGVVGPGEPGRPDPDAADAHGQDTLLHEWECARLLHGTHGHLYSPRLALQGHKPKCGLERPLLADQGTANGRGTSPPSPSGEKEKSLHRTNTTEPMSVSAR